MINLLDQVDPIVEEVQKHISIFNGNKKWQGFYISATFLR